MSIQDTIREQVTGHPVVLYMKGTPQFPQCGFSAPRARCCKSCGVDKFFSVNVLADAAIRQGIKEYSNWPTIPQLYVNGEFVGGCDIMREMHAVGRTAALAGAADGVAQSYRETRRPGNSGRFVSGRRTRVATSGRASRA